MTAPTITAIRPNTEDRTLSVLPYEVEIKGQPEPRVKVKLITDSETGALTVSVETPVADGKPLLNLSAMDRIARSVLPGARVYAGNKGHAAVKRRMYAAS